MIEFVLFTSLLAPVPAAALFNIAPQTVVQFSDSTFAENIGVRSNGHILVSVLSEPTLYGIDPTGPNWTAEPIHHFPNATGVAGITEIDDDVFAVASAIGPNVSFPRIWKLDFRGDTLNVAEIGDVPGSTSIHGIAALRKGNSPATAIMLADTGVGSIRCMDPATGTVESIVTSPLFAPSNTSTALGINGVKMFGASLYFTGSASGTFGRVPLTRDGYSAGEIEVLATLNRSIASFDDFAINSNGLALFAAHR
ncbi:uncharacterized protein Z518_00337 [Rhinocladiella mackenziei CBS 650.93]|uniref:Uncharacterized protein n=1 Tax=Rhinocladiella mackenziei CBS 650.93 TaxID=1442369 RepID=A0A0D2HEY6_9EURO|nr:uncharacterized protein Z518_00337 [Rhinocladiella mackenziei CBS 650.93]KIX09258.1 hypothetical protein Z518_00337 [Rhinocladiella mackenziei CBS 650.93]